MKPYVCSWCGKYSYISKNAARDAMTGTMKRVGLNRRGTVYRCEFDRKAFHFTSEVPERSHKYRDLLREEKHWSESDNPYRNGVPVNEYAWWRWYIFDGLSRFGAHATKTIKLPPERWSGSVNHSPWAEPAMVTIRKRRGPGR